VLLAQRNVPQIGIFIAGNLLSNHQFPWLKQKTIAIEHWFLSRRPFS
jgi:hypothetical protein